MAKKKQSASATPATQRLTAAAVDFSLHPYQHDPRAASFGLEAAHVLGVAPERVFKTLVVELDGQLAVGVVPVDGQLDLKALARALGGSKAVMAPVPAAERATGYVTGGISPIGQKRSLPTVIDESVLEHSSVFVSGGRRGLDIELAPAALIQVTESVVAKIRRP